MDPSQQSVDSTSDWSSEAHMSELDHFSFSSSDEEVINSMPAEDLEAYKLYAESWFDDHDLEFQPGALEEEMFLSVDFVEATYNISFEIIESQNDACSVIMSDFRPWIVFEDLFRCSERDVDMTELILKGLWKGPEHVTSTRGTFMGDGMSFIHLTLLQMGIVGWAFDGNWPIGQSIGDDLTALKARAANCLRYCWQAEQLGMKFSKLNAVCKDALTLCEDYAARISDIEVYRDINSYKSMIYHDLIFLDNLKGSVLSGKGKIQKDGSSSFIGHAKAAAITARYHPMTFVRERAKVLLWASNFHEAIKLGSAMASLPKELGGVDMLLGKIVEYSDEDFQRDRLPWYEAILQLPYEKFISYQILLMGIYRANPKGFAWENNWEIIQKVCQYLKIQRINPRTSELVPEHLRKGDIFKIFHYLEESCNLISIDRISEALSRREAYHKLWCGKVQRTFMTLKISNVKERSNHCWAIIKASLDPIDPANFRSTSMRHLASLFRERSWNVYVNREDEAIQNVLGGMPSLWIDSADLRWLEDHNDDDSSL